VPPGRPGGASTIGTFGPVRALRCAGIGLALWVAMLPAVFGQDRSALVKEGEYVLRAAGCGACHTQPDEEGPWLAGGRKLETPFGIFYTPNITPDHRFGTGSWNLEDLTRALRKGVGPGGLHFYPVFPYPSYAGMRDEDIEALQAYLESVPAEAKSNRPHELPWFLRFRIANRFWKFMFHSPRPFQERADKSRQWNRGAYLHLSGNPSGPEGDSVPNITPDDETGIGSWSASELTEYLSSGMLPDGDTAGGVMVEVIDDGLSHLRPTDVDAIVIYIRDIPAIRNAVK
jgi:mono/diheme cytochrome c family protein